MDDEIEDLRLHGNGNLLAAQLAPVGIEKVVPEQKLHVETQASLRIGLAKNKMKFGSKTVSLPKGTLGSSRSRDGSHAVRLGQVAVDDVSTGYLRPQSIRHPEVRGTRCSESHASHLRMTE
ncbi:hypothetical protein TM239_53710 [Bradyrhizobium sp. TM239]|nr:hypothetical protein TM239_53710 [Bradyrhizobium sp. TM239]